LKIESIIIKGFRCFYEDGETIRLDNLSCFVGPNASGKTAAMMALARIFGEHSALRQIIPSDFHLLSGENIKDKPTRKLLIECRLVLPELEGAEDSNAEAVPETFNQMVVDEPGGTPFCRIQLEATWTDDGTPSGDIDQSTNWILTSSDDPEVIKENKRKVQPRDRAKIRVVYVSASRNPDHQIRSTTATNFGRLMLALAWDGADESLKGKLSALQDELAGLAGIRTLNTQIQKSWNYLYDGRVAREVAFQALEEDPASLIKLLVPTFCPGEDGRTMGTSDLSDGLRSLFSFSLSFGLFRLEELLRETAPGSGFKAEVVEGLPTLTVFAIEEPENHLSPQYLGQVVAELLTIAKDKRAQVVLSSHSPSIIGRVEPDNVRYFLGHEHTSETRVKKLPLPEDKTDEAFKYVREAIRGFPELYFARLVILGEGASEQIVLRRLFEASGTPLDTHFISVVPLGGRHVNHFWRLLHGLKIPFLTLLDLDREKEGAGWGRVQYIRDQLVKQFGLGHAELRFTLKEGEKRSLEETAYDKLCDNADTDTEGMDTWLKYFQCKFGIFFSAPLDLDFAMLKAFPEAYKELPDPLRGPSLPAQETPEYKDTINSRMRQVLAADDQEAPPELGCTYDELQKELFPWYKYLFVDRSKPVAHMRALLKIDDNKLVNNSPDVLKQLLEQARELTSSKTDTT